MLSITLFSDGQDTNGVTHQFRTLDQLRSILQAARPWNHYSILGRPSLYAPLHALDIDGVILQAR